MTTTCPRVLVAGAGGDSGKTIVSLALTSELTQRGNAVAVFKKGPDYIDAAWLAAIAQRPARNLDTFLMGASGVRDILVRNIAGADYAVIEGNRGLHDGMDAEGSHSSAELARLTDTPVILVLDATKVTRTLAAVVLGCRQLDERINIAAVVLNRVAGSRHSEVATAAIEKYTSIPVVGVIPKLADDRTIPERHLGLVTVQESGGLRNLAKRLAEVARQNLDLDKIIQIAGSAPAIEHKPVPRKHVDPRVRIGVIRDSAFSFYYEDNLEALERAGAELVEFSSLAEKDLPRIDALYIGGGFPETHAEQLADNRSLRKEIRRAAEGGLPIYAECGGLMFLAKNLTWKGKEYPMCGALPIEIEVFDKPVGHGYSIFEVDSENLYYPTGSVIHGHEFHYSRIVSGHDKIYTAFAVKKGKGTGSNRDGIIYRKILASYTHVHELSAPGWAKSMVEVAGTAKP